MLDSRRKLQGLDCANTARPRVFYLCHSLTKVCVYTHAHTIVPPQSTSRSERSVKEGLFRKFRMTFYLGREEGTRRWMCLQVCWEKCCSKYLLALCAMQILVR